MGFVAVVHNVGMCVKGAYLPRVWVFFLTVYCRLTNVSFAMKVGMILANMLLFDMELVLM